MGSPFNQLQKLDFNLSGREIGIDKYKPYTFEHDRPHLDMGMYASLVFSVADKTSNIDVGIPSGNLEKSLLEEKGIVYSQSGLVVGNGFDIFDRTAALTGKVFGHPSDIGNVSFALTGSVDQPLNEASDIDYGWTGGLAAHTYESGNFRPVMVTKGNIYGYGKDASDLDFLFIAGSYQSGHTVPPIPPVLFPETANHFGDVDLLFLTGTYQGGL